MKPSPLRRTGPIERKTPMARGKAIERRKPLKPVGDNSKPNENLALRRRYAKQNPECELSAFFPMDYLPTENGPQALVGHNDPLDVHHILSNCRADVVTNIIRARRQIHQWAERYTIDGRVLSLCVKARKGELCADTLSGLLSESRSVVFSEWFSALESRILFDVSRQAFAEVTQFLRSAA